MLANIQKPSNVKDIDHQIHEPCTVRHAVPGHIHGGLALFQVGVIRCLYSIKCHT